MIDFSKLEAAADRISNLLPGDPGIVREEFKNSVKPILEAMLGRMDLVTREEFDAQAAVLRKTREKLDAIEAQLAAKNA